VAPISAIVCAVAVRNTMMPIWSRPIYLRRSRRTGRPPATAPISAPPYRWAARFNDNPPFGHDNDSRWGYFYSGRSLSYCRRRKLCSRRRCRIRSAALAVVKDCPSTYKGCRSRNHEPHGLVSSRIIFLIVVTNASEQHCRSYGKSARFKHMEATRAVFDCVN